MIQIPEHVLQQVSEFVTTNPAKPNGKLVPFEVQIEVPNPIHLWDTPPDCNVVMMDLRDQFNDAVMSYLYDNLEALGDQKAMYTHRYPRYYMKAMPASNSQEKKSYHAAVLIAEFCVRERYLPVVDAMAPTDTFTLDVPEWSIKESKEVQILWKNRVRTHEFIVHAEAEDGEPLDEEDTKLALQQLELPVTEVSSTVHQKGHRMFQATNHTALLQVDKVETFTQKEFMFGDKPIKLTLLWKPHGRLPARQTTDCAKRAYAQAIHDGTRYRQALMRSHYTEFDKPQYEEESGECPMPDVAQDNPWITVDARKRKLKVSRETAPTRDPQRQHSPSTPHQGPVRTGQR